MHDDGILARPHVPVTKNRFLKGNGGKGNRPAVPLPFPLYAFPLLPCFLSIVGINDASAEAAAVIAVVVIVDHQVESAINRSCKC